MDAGSRTTEVGAAGSAQECPPDEALWLSFAGRRVIVTCRACGMQVLLPQGVLIHARSLDLERWHLGCACGHAFSVEDFMTGGAVLCRGFDAILGIAELN